MKKFFREFKKFISRGNVVDMAIGVIIASAFTAIVTSITSKIITPIINWLLLLITGGGGLDQIYTYLKKVYLVDELGNATTTIDLANSIYIDWGAFLTAIINFFIVAFILFLILKAFNAANSGLVKVKKDLPTREERKILKQQGVDLKDVKTVLVKTAEMREKKKAEEDAKKKAEEEEKLKNSPEYILKEIRDLLKEKKGKKIK